MYIEYDMKITQPIGNSGYGSQPGSARVQGCDSLIHICFELYRLAKAMVALAMVGRATVAR
ncbi:UNVERIFIED_CONTAM: hypothetical protein K2H54_023410, partial [Gekko kuhli]